MDISKPALSILSSLFEHIEYAQQCYLFPEVREMMQCDLGHYRVQGRALVLIGKKSSRQELVGSGTDLQDGLVRLMVLPGRHGHQCISISFVKAAKAFSPLLFGLDGPKLFQRDMAKNLMPSHIKYYYV
jgi:hypothetical protein